MLRFTLFVLISAASAWAQDAATRLDQLVQPYLSPQRFMGTVLVARGNEILLNKAYGSANLEWNVANTPETKFRLGSVTKQFTAASILLNVGQVDTLPHNPTQAISNCSRRKWLLCTPHS